MFNIISAFDRNFRQDYIYVCLTEQNPSKISQGFLFFFLVTKITNFTGKNILVEKLVKAQGNSYFLVKKFALKFEEKKWK